MFLGKQIIQNYHKFKEDSITGRYIHFDHIGGLLEKHHSVKIGESELNIPIHIIRNGTGKKKIFIWSQMHGNESTGTKAMFDVLNFLENRDSSIAQNILNNCTIHYIPMLNPDGAHAYTRVNANAIDLNRDAVDLKAKESQLLREQLESINPQFCFNLHDQRTIFGVGDTANSAVLSFLAPSTEESRKITVDRIETMNVISAMNLELQKHIPNHIGRYTDEFYPTATGDNFQKMGFNTILIESGHYPNDYEREETRRYTFLSIVKGLHHIATHNHFDEIGSYFDIPNNKKSFFDTILTYNTKPNEVFQYKEGVENGIFSLLPEKVENIESDDYFFHKEIVFVD